MNKIIIDPHYCTREEYQELKDYLTDKTWDWQEVSSGEEEADDFNGDEETIMILSHVVSYYYNDSYEGKPDEEDIKHIEDLLSQGYREGELNTGEEEHRGWWKLV